MASGVRVNVTDRAVITALNTPGGAVNNWSDRVGVRIRAEARRTSPVNDVRNALHRGGVVGTYKRSWGIDRSGTNGHNVRVKVYNTADHAQVVEYGRRSTRGGREEKFTWSKAPLYNGEPMNFWMQVPGTNGREGQHILKKATNKVMPGQTYGNYTPL